MVEGDVEEVGGAAGGIENAEFAEAAMEAADFGGGLVEIAAVGAGDGGGLDGFPLAAQRCQDGLEHEALDIGARGEVSAERVALDGVEGVCAEGGRGGGVGAVGGGDEGGGVAGEDPMPF